MTGAKRIMAGGPWLGTDVNVSLDRRALAKGWVVAVGFWLLAGMGLILYVEVALRETFAGPTFLGSFFPLFAAVSVGVALVAGVPVAMALAWLLRPVRAQWVHVAVFYLVPTLLLAIPVGFAADGNPQATLVVGSVLGVCSAAGRVAVIQDAVIRDEPDAAEGSVKPAPMNPGFDGVRPAAGIGMTFDSEAGAGYIQLATGTIHESWPMDEDSTHLEVIVDVDGERRVLGVELLTRPGNGPEPILDAIADGTVAGWLSAEGFDVPQLRGNPTIVVDHVA